jgi:uncharacterized phage-associated protein
MCYCAGYSGLAIADYFIDKALNDGKAITNMHVLKMIYFAQAFGFVQLNRKLIRDDFYAWKFGPVEINTYKAFKIFGPNNITTISNQTMDEQVDLRKHPEIVDFLNMLYRILIDADTFALSHLTHIAGGPWYVTPMYQIIEPEKIRSYYERELSKQA